MRASLLPLLALVAVGCSVEHFDEEGLTAGQSAAVIDDAACPATRFIGPTSGSCGYFKGPSGLYQGTKLFDTSIPGLGTMCAYDWKPYVAGGLPTASDIAVVPPSYDRDCHVVGALASPVGSSPAVLGPLHDAFTRAAGATALPKLASGAQPQPIRVAVIDSSPSKIDGGKAIVGTYEHGFDIGRVVRELTCPSDDPARPPCIGQVSSSLALPLLAPDKRDAVNGGYFGTQTDLARAIVAAVDGWTTRRRTTATEPMRLVLNLSVGWDSDRGYERSATHTGMSWATVAVVHALRHASCRGALVLAAAGNRSGGGTESNGAMFPAAWEAVRAPTMAECERFEGTTTEDPRLKVFAPAGTYAPLLFAVGGVDAADRRLALSRPTGMPRLVAHGAEVVTSSSAGYSNNLTGTSMSTAVVSAAAAAAWAYAPTLAPAQLMSYVTSGAVDLSQSVPSGEAIKTSADFCLAGQVCGSIKRVTVAGSIAAVCASGYASCESGVVDPLKSKVLAAYAGKRPSWSTSWSTIDPKLAQKTSVGAECVGTNCALPSSKYVNQITKPWVGPQPGKGGCDVCGLTGFGDFYLVLTDPWWQMGPTTAYLGVDSSTGSYAYSVPVTQQASTYTLKGVDSGSTVYSAQLSFTPPSQTPYATMEQVMYWP